MNSEIGLTVGEYVSPIVERYLTCDSLTIRHLSFKNAPFESFFSLWNSHRLMMSFLCIGSMRLMVVASMTPGAIKLSISFPIAF